MIKIDEGKDSWVSLTELRRQNKSMDRLIALIDNSPSQTIPDDKAKTDQLSIPR